MLNKMDAMKFQKVKMATSGRYVNWILELKLKNLSIFEIENAWYDIWNIKRQSR